MTSAAAAAPPRGAAYETGSSSNGAEAAASEPQQRQSPAAALGPSGSVGLAEGMEGPAQAASPYVLSVPRRPLGAAEAVRVDVAFKDLTYSAPGGRAILQGVSGAAPAGAMTAIMGSSGCGKSTLLDVLAGLKPAARVGGAVCLGGARASEALTRRLVGYCQQEDALIETLTPRDMLAYTWRMTHRRGGAARAAEAVEEIIADLGIQSCADTVIGGGLIRGISGGERKRTAVAVAMLRSPRVLLLDEPTSGLDATTAAEVMGALRLLSLRRGGLTTVTSIHAPSESVFAAFDRLLVLAGGRVVFSGAPVAAADWLGAARGLLATAGAALPAAGSKGAAKLLEDTTSGLLQEDSNKENSAAVAAGKAAQRAVGGVATGVALPEAAAVVIESEAAAAAALVPTVGVAELVSEIAYKAQRDDAAAEALHNAFESSPAGAAAAKAVSLAISSPLTPSPSLGANLSIGGSRLGSSWGGLFSGGGGGVNGTSAEANGSTSNGGGRENGQGPQAQQRLPSALRALVAGEEERAAWWQKLGVLFRYRVLPNWTSWVFGCSLLIDKLAFTLVLLSLYWGVAKSAAPAAALNTAAVLFMHSQLAAFSGIPYVSLLFRERRVFIREVNDGLYPVTTFFVLKLIEAAPVVLAISALLNGILWPAVGLKGAWAALWLAHASVMVFGILMGMLFWSAVPFVELAGGLLATFIVMLCLLSGFLITYSSIPFYWRWLAAINPMRYAWGAMMINQFATTTAPSPSTLSPSALTAAATTGRRLLQAAAANATRAVATAAATAATTSAVPSTASDGGLGELSVIPADDSLISSSFGAPGATGPPDPVAYYELTGATPWAFLGWMALAFPVLLVANIVAGRLLIYFSKK